MYTRRTFLFCFAFLTGILFMFTRCSDSPKNSFENTEGKKRPATFASDEEFLDFIQKHHLNYMWEGAEPNSGLARERIHIDIPSNDSSIITTGAADLVFADYLQVSNADSYREMKEQPDS